jgi:hypothetical protein
MGLNPRRTIKSLFLLFVFLCSIPSLTRGASFKHSYAVVVGIDSYSSPQWPRLSYARKDAEAMAKYLAAQGYQVTALFNENATRQRILGAFDVLERTLKPDDRVLVFIASHGTNKRVGDEVRGYIVPYDGRDFPSFISYTEIQDASLLMKNARHQLFIIDACFGGLMMTRSGGVPPDVPDYIEEVTERVTREFMSAGGAFQEVLDTGPNGHSIFTSALLDGLAGGADLNRDGYITFAELETYVTPLASNAFQTPARGVLPGHRGGEYVFLSPLGRRTPAATATLLPKVAVRRGDELSTANGLLKESKFIEAISIFRASATAGNSEAIFYVGLCYANGWGVLQDYQQAHQWFEAAAAGGDSNAMSDLGFMYARGDGVVQNYQQARQWYEKAIAAGNSEAMHKLGFGYAKG